MKIYFYPHKTLRDRQLDTVRFWPRNDGVVNRDDFEEKRGSQVSASYANSPKVKWSWKSRLPLVNIKMRPADAPKDAIVYVWGGVIATGKFIVDIDNPWSLVGYNLRAMPIYRWLLKRILLSDRCCEIRCMSEACHKSLKELFGKDVYDKAKVHYPYMDQKVTVITELTNPECRFLFVGTQFEIKGGEALLKAFRRVYEQSKNCKLDVITHLPEQFEPLACGCSGIEIHKACFTRDEIHSQFMEKADVLLHPTYCDSFGMVVLEALSYGLAIIATDVYALGEMVEDSGNGNLIAAPISNWDGVMPSAVYYNLENVKQYIRETDTREFEQKLEVAIKQFVEDKNWRLQARRASIKLMKERFAC